MTQQKYYPTESFYDYCGNLWIITEAIWSNHFQRWDYRCEEALIDNLTLLSENQIDQYLKYEKQ